MDNPKDQLADRIKNANNVLITVSTNPSVDQLAAAIGLTLVLNKLKKHATTVFSGEVPSTIEFLSPDETIETNTDSLRDFIISLDKAKADKIRYKVEDTMVKIFITPYKTSITDDDLVFSQGDFNVDVVVALGVQARDDLDQAITTHGRILHDATVATVNVTETSEMGAINWTDKKASSLCEMVVGLISDLKEDVLDEQMATAFLTGIVAETKRFSNERTTSDTMSASAVLMAAGANQQLVATKLDILTGKPESEDSSDDDDKDDQDSGPREVSVDEDGSLRIHHESDKSTEEPKDEQPTELAMPELPEPKETDAAAEYMPPHPADKAPKSTEEPKPTALEKGSNEPPQTPDVQVAQVVDEPAQPQLRVGHRRAFDAPPSAPSQQLPAEEPSKQDAVPSRVVSEPPSTGGALNATTDQKTGDEPVLAPPSREKPALTRSTTSPPAFSPLPAQPPAEAPSQPARQASPFKPPTPVTMSAPPKPHVDKTTLKDIETAVDSHHRSEPAKVMEGKTLQAIEDAVSTPQSQPNQTESSTEPEVSSEDEIRARIDEALKNSADANAPALEPISALGAGGRMEISHDTDTSTEEASKDIQIDTDGTLRYPENLVPNTKELPKDQTAAPAKDALAPPPVPPPMTIPSPNSTP